MKKILLLLCALSLFSSLALASGSRGLPSSNFTRPSSAQEVGLMFYKLLGHTAPPYDYWIESDPRYKAMTPEQKAQVLASERTRLKNAYAILDMKKAAVIVRTAVKLEVQNLPPLVPGEPARNVLKVKFPADAAVYFPYSIGGQTIAVIPNGIDLYREIPLTPNEAVRIKARLDVSGSATMALEVPPRAADGTKPMMMDGLPQWLLFGEIGFMGLYNSYTEMLWSYQAPSYVMQGQDALLNLRSATIPDKPATPAAPAPAAAAK